MTTKVKSVRTPKKQGDRRGTNPNSLANLAPPWKAGDPSPNPTGKPKLLGESYKAMLGMVNADDPLKRTNAEIIADAMRFESVSGNVAAAREIRSATEGDKLTLDDIGYTDEQRAERIAALLDAARARRAGQAHLE